jgi:hypothetical protein
VLQFVGQPNCELRYGHLDHWQSQSDFQIDELRSETLCEIVVQKDKGGLNETMKQAQVGKKGCSSRGNRTFTHMR